MITAYPQTTYPGHGDSSGNADPQIKPNKESLGAPSIRLLDIRKKISRHLYDGWSKFILNEYKASWNVDGALHQILNKSIVEHQSIQDYIIIGGRTW